MFAAIILKCMFCVCVCQAVLGLNSRSDLLAKCHPSNRIGLEPPPENVDVKSESVATNSGGVKFVEFATKIRNVENKIQSRGEIWRDFDSIFRGINDNYNTFHYNRKNYRDSSVRKAVSDSFQPIVSMIESEPNLCSHLNFGDGESDALIGDINDFITEFHALRDDVAKLSPHELFAQSMKMGMNSTFTDFKDWKTPSGAPLGTSLKKLAARSFSNKLQQACVLADGALNYVLKVIFSLDILSFFADEFYEKGDMEKHNLFFELLASGYSDAMKSLNGKDSSGESIIQMVLRMLRGIRWGSVTGWLSKKIEILALVESHLGKVEIPVILDVPEKLTGPDFGESPIVTPIGPWQDGANVSYAVQYRHNNMYSRLGEWMEPITVAGEANPTLRLRVHPKRFDRLVFRKFNNQKPQLAGALEDKYQTEFRDINRDLYDAAAKFDKKSMADANVLIRNGANIHAVFEGGRRAIHAAAQSNNVDLAKNLLLGHGKNIINVMNDNVNAKDNEGYTPLHLASQGGHRQFIKMLLENGGDVNAKTYLKHWTPLHIAADRGFVSAVRTLLTSQEIDVNAREKGGFSPVHRAVEGGIPVLELLMADNRTDVQAKSDANITPLILAIIEAYDDVTNALLANKNVDVNLKTNTNMTALAVASIIGNTQIVQSLLTKSGVDVNVETIAKWTPLHLTLALKNNATNVLLSMNQTNADASTSSKMTPLHIASVTDQKDVANILIHRGVDIDEQTISGLASIHLALLYKNYDIFNILVEGGADIQAKSSDGSSLLHFAINNNKFDVIESLLKKGVNINAKNMVTGETPLHTAARLKNREVIKILVKHLVQVNVQDERGETPLHYIASCPSDNADILIMLTGAGGDVNLRDHLGRTPLHLAVLSFVGDTEIIENLVDRGAEINAKDHMGQTPLHMAAALSDGSLTTLILGKRGDVNAQDYSGRTPLHTAVNYQNEKVVDVLLDREASLMKVDRDFQTPVHLAVAVENINIFRSMKEKRRSEVYKTILTSSSSSSSSSSYTTHLKMNSPLHLAIVLGNIEMVREMIDFMGDGKSDLRKTLYETAAASGKLDILNELTSHLIHYNYDYARSRLSSSLCLAAKFGFSDIVQKLVDLRVYVNGDGAEEDTPICCIQQDSVSLQILVNEGAEVAVECSDGLSPLQKAARSGYIDVAKVLIERIYKQDVDDQILMEVLVQNGNINRVKDLIDRGVSLNEIALGGITKLHIMSQSGSLTDVKLLVDSGASVNSTTRNLETPLHFAATGGNLETINYFVSNFADINAKDSLGRTPLHWALNSQSASLTVVKSLVELGAQLNIKCLQGKTPLHVAAKGHGSLDVIKYLLSKNVDVNSKDFEGNTPLFDAVRSGNIDIIKSLVEGGATVTILNKYQLGPEDYIASILKGDPRSKYFSNLGLKHVSLPAMEILNYLMSR